MNNILMIIPNLDFGGAQRSFSKVCNELSRYHNVYVCVFNTDRGIAFDLDTKIVDLKIPASSSPFKKGYNFFRRIYKIKKVKKKLNIDIAISYLEGANYVNILSRLNEKVIISLRGSIWQDETITGLIGWTRKWVLIPYLYKKADLIVCLNKGIKNELTSIYKFKFDKITVIYNFYNIQNISNQANEKLPSEFQEVFESPTLIAAGRLAPEKGFFYLIDIYSRLVTFNGNYKLVILGDGPQKNALIMHAQQKGLKVYCWEKEAESPLKDYQVFLLGYKKNPYKYISQADIFTITSSSEGGPNVLSEAMICETLVISTDCPSGPREKISPDTCRPSKLEQPEVSKFGVLLPMLNFENNEKSINAWTKSILEITNKKKKYRQIVKNAKENMENFSQEVIFEKWNKIASKK